MAELSERCKTLLRDAGWHEERSVNISDYENVLQKEGYPVHQCVQNFLSSFAGLRIFIPTQDGFKDTSDILIDPIKAVEQVFIERVSEEYNSRTGCNLCVFGFYCGHMVLMMSTDGQVFGGYDEFLVHIGNSAEDAIEAMCGIRDFIEVE